MACFPDDPGLKTGESLFRTVGPRGILGVALLFSAAAGPFLLSAPPASAQSAGTITPTLAQSTGTIDRVVIEGNQRIDESTILSYMTLRAGDPFEQGPLDDTIKRLFGTGLFADVTLAREGDSLIVSVVENPIINRISFEGNSRLEDDVLLAEVQLRPRVVYTRTRVQTDVSRVVELYRRNGRFAATVDPKVIRLDQNRVDLVFEIDEGPVTGIERISFVGNRAFSDRRLRSVLATKESAFYRILNPNDTYDPDRLAFDEELLRRFYQARGYPDFRVVSSVAELTPDREEFFITFTVEEGERYAFGAIDVVSNVPEIDVESLREVVTTAPGDVYSADAVEESVGALTDTAGDRQFAFADVRPEVRRNRDARTLDITYAIGEGRRVFVERIDIIGNVRTEDRVIRREIQLVEGDPFNRSRLQRSEANIRNLDYFESVEVSALPGSSPDRSVVEVRVSEKSTGEFSFGTGFSSTEGPIGDVSLRERNLLGRGQDLRIGATISGRRQLIDLSFTEPYFLERDLEAGFDLFRVVRENSDRSSYEERVFGGGLRTGYPLGENLRHRVGYVFEDRLIRDVDADASPFIVADSGGSTKSAFNHELTYDRLDSRINPSDGYRLRIGNEVAGAGGDTSYLQTTAAAAYYQPVTDSITFSLRGEAGFIVGIGEDVRLNDRFFVGGNNFRGFEPAGIGPRDLSTDDALGGNSYAVGTVEVTFPVGLPQELGVRGRAFSDFGTLASLDSAPGIDDSHSLRVSAGFGFTYATPVGPLQLDFAFPLIKEDFDRTESFRFSIGATF